VSEERFVSYTGPRSWPISAAVSFFGTTSGVVSLLFARVDNFPVPHEVMEVVAAVLGMFFLFSLWMSVLGGGWLAFRHPTDDLGILTLRGKPLSEKAWSRILAMCYLTPWAAIVAAIFILITSV